MQINDINITGGIQPLRSPANRPTEVEPKPDSQTSLPTDRADLNKDVQGEARILDGAKLVYEALPDVRADKIAQAKKRLAAGYYDQPAVQNQIAARLAADPEARPVPPLSLEQRAEIRQRLAEGYYDQPKANDSIAKGLAEDAQG